MNDWFSFEQSPWNMAVQKLREGDAISAVRLLTLLEGEEEDALEDAFQTLDELAVTLGIADLPEDFGNGDTEKRLRLEKKLAGKGLQPADFPEGDPLRMYLEEMAPARQGAIQRLRRSRRSGRPRARAQDRLPALCAAVRARRDPPSAPARAGLRRRQPACSRQI